MSSPPFRWDGSRYRDARGRYIPAAEVRRILDRALDSGQLNARTLSEKLRAREIDVREWQAGMSRIVKRAQIQSAASAVGGVQQMSPALYGAAGAKIKEQYRYLQRFADELAAGLPRDGRMLMRAGMYADAGRATYHTFERRRMQQRGFDEKRNRRFPGDSCPGCVEAEDAGWVAIDSREVPEIGGRECRTNCRCRWSYRNSSTGDVIG